MGNCCKSCAKNRDRASQEFKKFGRTFKSIVQPVADDGSEVMNAIAGELWPSMVRERDPSSHDCVYSYMCIIYCPYTVSECFVDYHCGDFNTVNIYR
jgi:hypothetical protein